MRSSLSGLSWSVTVESAQSVQRRSPTYEPAEASTNAETVPELLVVQQPRDVDVDCGGDSLGDGVDPAFGDRSEAKTPDEAESSERSADTEDVASSEVSVSRQSIIRSRAPSRIFAARLRTREACRCTFSGFSP